MRNNFFSVILSIILSVSFLSCKKEATGISSGTLSAVIDGKEKLFQFSPIAMRINGSPNYQLILMGYNGTSGVNTDFLNFSLQGTKEITTGTYSEATTPGNNIVFLTYGEFIGGAMNTYSTGVGSTKPLTFTISSIDTKSVQGSFSGDIYLRTGTGTLVKRSLTDGKFNLNFQ